MKQQSARIRALFLLLPVAILNSCNTTPYVRSHNICPGTPTLEVVQDFFPMSAGSSWTYRYVTHSMVPVDGYQYDTLQYKNLRESEVGGLSALVRETQTTQPYRSTSQMDYAVQGDTLYGWNLDSWSVVFPESYLPNHQFGDTIYSRHDPHGDLDMILERTDSTVVTPAGRFEYCFLVSTKSHLYYADTLLYTETYLYKIGVGLVASESALIHPSSADTQYVVQKTLLDYTIEP